MKGIGIAAALLFAAPVVAQAPALNAAQAPGAVGERYDGYLGVAAPVAQPVRGQVASINIQRRQLYTKLAASKGVSPQDVGITAGCQLLGRVGGGHSYMLADGVWRRRVAGQPAPVPDYCR
jgi:uncharacterized protein YdbL (DUF1318 family)